MTTVLRFEDYTIGWICALQIEVLAARFMLDEEHEGVFPTRHGDDNEYIPGRIGVHNVVVVGLPKNSTGTVSAASLVSEMRGSFRKLRYGLMVGIGAGVPGLDLKPDIRLGDVVIATPADNSDDASGVIGYESGKETVDGFVKKGCCYPTDRRLRNAFTAIETKAQHDGRERFLQYLNAFQSVTTGERFRHPGIENDQLHRVEADAESGAHRLVLRKQRDSMDPVAHYGLVASGDKLVKNPKVRDALRDKYNIICIEMEAAGLMNTLPVAVIRGICDYADSYKNDDWQPYAAGTASAYAKGLLYRIGAELEANSTRPHEAVTDISAILAQDQISAKATDSNISRFDHATDYSLYRHPPYTESATNLFHQLGRGSRYIANSEHFWGHLTMHSLEIYRRIYADLVADKRSLIASALREKLYSLDGSATWRLEVDDSFTALQCHFPVIHRNIGLAFIYVLHMRRDTNNKLERDRQGHAKFSQERRNMIARFDEWILCDCPCGSTWNFARYGGLQDEEKHNRPCLVAKWLRSSVAERVTSKMFPSQLRTGQKFYESTFGWWASIEIDVDN